MSMAGAHQLAPDPESSQLLLAASEAATAREMHREMHRETRGDDVDLAISTEVNPNAQNPVAWRDLLSFMMWFIALYQSETC